jgi:hypothetical protein
MPQEGGFLNMRSLLIVAAVAVGAYFLFFRNSSSAGSPSTSGGGGTITTGPTTVKSGAVTVNVKQSSAGTSSTGDDGDTDGTGGGGNPQPKPPRQVKIPGHHTLQAPGNETLAQIAKKYDTTPDNIVDFTQSHKPHISNTEKKFFSHPTGKVPKGIMLWIPEPQVAAQPEPGVNPGGINIPA